MQIRDRIKEFKRVKASDLLPHPSNWRQHPPRQMDAMRGILAEIGYAGALLAYETEFGMMLIDGHARAELTPDQEVPVLVLDVDDDEAKKLLALVDPLGAMASTDDDALKTLAAGLESDNAVLSELLSNAGQWGTFGDITDDAVLPPEDFASVDETINTEHTCPKCGYKWSGGQ